MQTLCTIAKVVSVLGPFGQAAGALAGAAIVGYSLARKTFDEVYKRCKKACKIPIFCDIVCVIVAGAAAVAAGFAGLIAGAIVGALPGIGPLAIGALISRFVRHDGQWRDVQNDPESGHIEEGDCVIVAGDEVYDAGHSEGWAEMHPVIHLQKMCAKEEGLTDTADVCCEGALTHSARFMSSEFRNGVNRTWDNWCAAVKAGYKPETIRNQSQPLNSWSVHPLIDGCLPRGEGTAGPVVR
jgi:hypothetical protein